MVTPLAVVARMLNDGEKAALAQPTLDGCAATAETPYSRSTIVDAYDWDDVHPSRCVIL